jgi:hypothetical protein
MCELISEIGRILHIKMYFLTEVVIFDYSKTNNAVTQSEYKIMVSMKLFELVRAGALRLERG